MQQEREAHLHRFAPLIIADFLVNRRIQVFLDQLRNISPQELTDTEKARHTLRFWHGSLIGQIDVARPLIFDDFTSSMVLVREYSAYFVPKE